MRKPPRPATLILGLLLVAGAIWRLFTCASAPPPPLLTLLSASAPTASASAVRPVPARARVEAPRPVLPLLTASASADKAAPLGAFEGHVVSAATGKGISGARLVLEHAGSTSEVACGEGGAFRFVPQAAGTYTLAHASAEGFLPFAPEWDRSPIHWTARPAARVSGFVLALDPATPFVIEVKSPDGKPVAGAEVRVLGGEAASAAKGTTDAQGSARVAVPRDAIVEARHADFAPGRTRVTASAEAAHRLTIRLRSKGDRSFEGASAAVAGKVVDATGAPVGGARVVASLVTENSAAEGADLHPTGIDVSDADGTFRVEGLDPGAYDLVASDDEHAPARARGVASGSEDVTLKMSGGGGVRGVVREGGEGKPAAAFSVVVSLVRGPLEREQVAVRSFLDAEGRYEIEGLGPGSYEVIAVALGWAPSATGQATIAEPPGEPAIVDLSLSRGGKLRGTVKDARTDKPIEGARVALEGLLGGASDLPLLATTLSGADGAFELNGLGMGTRSLTVTAAGHHGRIVGSIAVGSVEPPPITVALTPTEKDEEPGIELVGIGAVLTAKDDVLLIGQVIAGGGAAAVGLGPGDAVLAIDGTLVTTLGFEGSISQIRGPEGTTVILRVRKAGATDPVDIAVMRQRIKG